MTNFADPRAAATALALAAQPGGSASYALDLDSVRDLRPDVLDDDGRMKVLPESFWATTTPQERAALGHRIAVYSFPTVELVDHLRDLIGGRSAIEIGSGHGVLAQALSIPATDSRQQEEPKYRRIYESTGQPIVSYGPNVVTMHASRAVRHYKPKVVIGCWVTHKFDPRRPEAGGNEVGVDLLDVRLHCETLVLVGNEHVHRLSPLWDRPHTIEFPSFVYSRAANGSRDFVATWKGRT